MVLTPIMAPARVRPFTLPFESWMRESLREPPGEALLSHGSR